MIPASYTVAYSSPSVGLSRAPPTDDLYAEKAPGNLPTFGDKDAISKDTRSLPPLNPKPQQDPGRSSNPPELEAPSGGVPVYVMLPLDMVRTVAAPVEAGHAQVDARGNFLERDWLGPALAALSQAGVRGVATDIWWGAVEQDAEQYKWSGYRKLFDRVKEHNLKLQVVFSFHSCGGNVGDDVNINLPKFVEEAIGQTAGYFYRGVTRERFNPELSENKEYISLFADLLECLPGKGGQSRTPLQCYADFMRSFREEFKAELGDLIEEVVVGSGPCGELRYPSYVEEHGWRFPGVGEFQSQGCNAKQSFAAFINDRAAQLERAAEAADLPVPQRQSLIEDAGRIREYLALSEQPEDGAGTYNSRPDETQFFNSISGSWNSEPGRLFLEWYHGALVDHGDRLLKIATAIFRTKHRPIKNLPVRRPVPIPQPPQPPDAVKQAAAGAKQGFKPLTAVLDVLKKPFRPSEEDDVEEEELLEPMEQPFRWAIARLRSFSGRKPLEKDRPEGAPVEVTLKIAGVHWYYAHPSHAAELTAGYHNTEQYNGYRPIVEMCARRGVGLTLTCVEMRDQDHAPDAFCSPKRLIRLVRETCADVGVSLAGENALPLFTPGQVNVHALYRIVENTDAWLSPLQENLRYTREADPGVGELSSVAPQDLQSVPNRSGDKPRAALLPAMRSFTFLRLTDQILQEPYASEWRHFMYRMRRNGSGRLDPEADPYGPPNYSAGMKLNMV